MSYYVKDANIAKLILKLSEAEKNGDIGTLQMTLKRVDIFGER